MANDDAAGGRLIRFCGILPTLWEWRGVVAAAVGREGTHPAPYGYSARFEVRLTDADREALMPAWRAGWNARVAFEVVSERGPAVTTIKAMWVTPPERRGRRRFAVRLARGPAEKFLGDYALQIYRVLPAAPRAWHARVHRLYHRPQSAYRAVTPGRGGRSWGAGWLGAQSPDASALAAQAIGHDPAALKLLLDVVAEIPGVKFPPPWAFAAVNSGLLPFYSESLPSEIAYRPLTGFLPPDEGE